MVGFAYFYLLAYARSQAHLIAHQVHQLKYYSRSNLATKTSFFVLQNFNSNPLFLGLLWPAKLRSKKSTIVAQLSYAIIMLNQSLIACLSQLNQALN